MAKDNVLTGSEESAAISALLTPEVTELPPGERLQAIERAEAVLRGAAVEALTELLYQSAGEAFDRVEGLICFTIHHDIEHSVSSGMPVETYCMLVENIEAEEDVVFDDDVAMDTIREHMGEIARDLYRRCRNSSDLENIKSEFSIEDEEVIRYSSRARAIEARKRLEKASGKPGSSGKP